MLPTGTVTFLYSDIEGSTPLWEQVPDDMQLAIAQHHAILRQAVEGNHGVVFDTEGDSFKFAFQLALQGLYAAIEAQRNLRAASWPQGTGPLRVLMGNAAKARECLLAASRIVAEVDTVRRSELYERQHDLGRCDLVEDKPNEAEQCFKECINWAKISGYRILLVPCMRGLAAAALKCEQLERSASLYGAADLLSILQGYTTLEPWWEVMHQRYFASLGEQIDPQAFERAWQEGRNMSLEEALAYALET